MKICYEQDEALLRRFYQTMYPLLPLYQARRKRLLSTLGIICAVLAAAYFFTYFILFLIGAIAVAVLLAVNAVQKISDKTIDRVVEFNRKEYGDDAVSIVVECKKDKIAAGRQNSDAEDYIEYGELTDILYDDTLFCMVTQENAYYFPISAIPEGKDALIAFLQEKNPAIQVKML